MNRKDYPPEWDAIARQVKDEANWKCEQCQRQCIRPGQSISEFLEVIRITRLSECPVVAEFLQHPKRWQLGVAHLDHRPHNCQRSNLKALCTGCHGRYDLSQMGLKRRLKLERQGQLRLEGVL